jgi:hypothetical protein
MAALATVIPVGLVLGLLMFGTYGTHRPPAITPGRVVPVVALTILLGPVTAAAFGFVGWMAVMFLLVAAILMVAVLRNPPLQS